MRSIRKTLIAGTIGAMAASLAGSGAFLFLAMRSSLLRQFDDALLEKAAVLMTSVEVKAGRTIFDDEDLDMGEIRSVDGPGYLEIVAADGDSLYRSPSLAGGALDAVTAVDDEPRLVWVRLPDGRDGRAAVSRFEARVDDEDPANGAGTREGGAVSFVFARDTAPVMEAVRRLELVLLAFGAGTIAIAGALLHAVIRKALRPMDAVASAIHAIGPDDLSAQLDSARCPEELRPVVERLNDLFARLKRAFDRERAFSADVAHELRTPLAGIRTTLEVALTRPRTAPEYAVAMKECLDVAAAMQAMIENLLTLARLDSGELGVAAGPVALGAVFQQALAPAHPAFAARNIDVTCETAEDVVVESDASLLRIAARNLIDNALAYTNDGGWVKIAVRPDGPNAVARIANSGSRISEGEVRHVFDRFWRADAARSETGAHCGLGLALVKTIVTTLGGTAEVTLAEGGVFEIGVSLPRRGGQHETAPARTA